MIAITGANGLLGSFIVRKLIEMKEPFVALKRAGSDTSLLDDVASSIEWRDADVLDEVALSEAFENVTHVIHSAATVSFNPRKAKLVMEINVTGTRNVVNACLTKNIKRLVHISSVAALGRQKGQNIITESNKWISSSLNSVYGESKYFAELEVFRGQEEGLSTIIINPSLIIAPADWNKSSAQFFKYVWEEKPFYIGGFLNYVDVRDVAEICCRMVHHEKSGERFIVSAGKISYENFFQKIAALFQKKAPSIKLHKNLLFAAALIESFRTRFVNSEPFMTRERARLVGTEFMYESEKIKKILSFEFQPIEHSLAWCCGYYIAKMTGKK